MASREEMSIIVFIASASDSPADKPLKNAAAPRRKVRLCINDPPLLAFTDGLPIVSTTTEFVLILDSHAASIETNEREIGNAPFTSVLKHDPYARAWRELLHRRPRI
jgi:hypothetical protein